MDHNSIAYVTEPPVAQQSIGSYCEFEGICDGHAVIQGGVHTDAAAAVSLQVNSGRCSTSVYLNVSEARAIAAHLLAAADRYEARHGAKVPA